jgi:hypothetical protein
MVVECRYAAQLVALAAGIRASGAGGGGGAELVVVAADRYGHTGAPSLTTPLTKPLCLQH